ncbi:hypothetical protein C8R46DRAFT_1230152 [Mycena filopes]|nr:hypothetical protein C8R46DRAFT_1230152 [Mycena filopes]
MATVASPQRPPHSHSRSRSPTKHDAYLPSSPFPSSPSLTDLRPNAHPYPIATTATGVLTRSNSLSSPSAGNGGRHHYVPPSPGASPTHARTTQTTSKDGAGAERRTEYRGHRYSRSLSNSEDNTRAYGESSGGGGGNVNGPRALPVPPGVSANSIAAKEAARKGGWSAYAGGPSPKRWTPAQLAAHLDRTISPEAGAWAARSNVGGKAFMRMREEELEAMGAPPALRPAARALRQEVLQLQHQLATSPSSSVSDLSEHSEDADLLSSSPTRIHEEPEEEEEDDGTPQHDRDDNRRRTMSVPSPSPFALKQFAPAPGSPFASLSNATAPGPAPYSDASPTGGRFRNGRVRGMVRSFESSGSEADEGSPEREREHGSGFRNGGAGGSGFRAAANGSGFRNGNGNGKGGDGNGNESESGSGEDGVGGTVRAQRALPVRPDGAEGVLDLGATVRGGSEHGHGHGRTSSNRTRAPGGDYTSNSNSNSNSNTAREDEMTVEELLALEGDAAPAQGVLSPAHTGGGAGSWRRNRRRGHKAAGGQGTEEIQTQRTGESVTPQRTGGGGGGRPLPAHPHASPLARSSSGGVHAWESDEEPVGGTVKWVPANVPTAATLFASITELPPTPPRDQEATPPRNHEAEAAAARERARAAMVAEAEAQERGRARGAAVRAQLQEAAALRTLVDAFRVRLEEVERRVGVMEAEASSSAALGAPNSDASLSVVQRLDPRRLLALFAPVPRKRGGEEGAKNNGNNNTFVGPTTLGALPSYVLLVSLGMCAVVLRVLVKKSLGAVRRGA